MNSITTRLTLFAVIATVGPAAFAQNLVSNSTFDAGVSGWSHLGGVPFVVSWSPEDEGGDPASGSLRVAGTVAGHSASVYPHPGCVQVESGEMLSFGASVRALDGMGQVRAQIRFFSDAGCLSDRSSVNADLRYQFPRSSWGSTHEIVEVPVGVGSARLIVNALPSVVAPTEILIDNAYLYRGAVCVANSTTMCLAKDRFRVTSEWRTPDGTRGWGQVHPLTDDSGYFWFFDPANVEVVAKVLDACAFNDRFWVFAAGLTNVEVVTTVYDTLTDETWTSTNGLGSAFEPIQDTGAFATCEP